MIRKNKKGEYVLFSFKTGRVLGRYKDRQAAENRERQIHYFKIKSRRNRRFA